MSSKPGPNQAAQAKRLLNTLRSPAHALPAFGQVHDQETARFVPYRAQAISHQLQPTILDYMSNPPRLPTGETQFLTLLGYRQGGKSLSVEYAAYCKAAYIPGWDHVAIADNRDRAEYLHKRVHHLHQRWPEQLRSETLPTRESRQLTFDPNQGGKMRILSAEAGAVGVGQSPDSFHASECHLWSDFAGSMFLINPSLINRREALVVFEATPWERNCAWHEHYLMAKAGDGRHFAAFFPFWDGILNQRPWPKEWTLENEEIDLLNRYGSLGLTKENLAFRRLLMDTDPEIRRHPEMFGVMYPFDDVSCWTSATAGAIPQHALEKHTKAHLVTWAGPYMEYEAPEAGAIYAIGVDPSGYAARDHAAFHVLKCWRDEWTQVATFAAHIDPLKFTDQIEKIGMRYNKALVVVESNGVGQAVLSLLVDRNYSNLYYEAKFKPGFTATSKSLDQATGWLIDGLLDDFILRDKDTVEQLQSYKNDKRTEESANAEILRRGPNVRRRERHHWDKVSALIMATVAARAVPCRERPGAEPKSDNLIMFTGMSYDEQEQYRKKVTVDRKPARSSRATYRSIRRRKR